MGAMAEVAAAATVRQAMMMAGVAAAATVRQAVMMAEAAADGCGAFPGGCEFCWLG